MLSNIIYDGILEYDYDQWYCTTTTITATTTEMMMTITTRFTSTVPGINGNDNNGRYHTKMLAAMVGGHRPYQLLFWTGIIPGRLYQYVLVPVYP